MREPVAAFVRWEACRDGELLTYPDVLQRLGLTNGQRVDESTGWAVIRANRDRLAKLLKAEPS